jgi:hypothetical protein
MDWGNEMRRLRNALGARPGLLAAIALLAIGAAAPGPRAEAGEAQDARAVDQDVQALKQQALELNRELFTLEEQLLYPENTQVAVFLSLDVGTFFALESVQLRLDDKEVANYLYSDSELRALQRGGVQKLYLGNLKSGDHELVAFFSGKGPHDRDYRRGTSLKFRKPLGIKYLELRITDHREALQPEFVVRQWE